MQETALYCVHSHERGKIDKLTNRGRGNGYRGKKEEGKIDKRE